jgi:hypothetical protein
MPMTLDPMAYAPELKLLLQFTIKPSSCINRAGGNGVNFIS